MELVRIVRRRRRCPDTMFAVIRRASSRVSSFRLRNRGALAAFWQGEVEPLEPAGGVMSSPSWNTAAYWRERAIEMRKLADDVKDAGTRAVIRWRIAAASD
jgi:hypothetical protein